MKRRRAPKTERTSSRARRERLRARATIYLKEPLVSRAGGLPAVPVCTDKDSGILPGPTSARFVVVDYDPTTDRLERAAMPALAIMGRGVDREQVFDFVAKSGTPQEAQINAWMTAVDTLDLFQQRFALGREIPWAFEGSRLRILPHAFYEANAFYSRQTHALHLGYFRGRDATLVKTALSHDVIAHETAHAVLDGLRPYYLEQGHADTAAFHEYVGDLSAMLSLFRERRSLAGMAAAPSQTTTFRDLVGAIAPEVGKGLYGQADRYFLRSAANRLTLRDVRDELECHARSRLLSGFALDVLEAIYRLRVRSSRRGRRPKSNGQAVFRHLWATARAGVRLLLRPLDLLPPGGIRFHEYAATILRLDRIAYPDDDLGYRAAVEAVMRRRGIMPSVDEMRSWSLGSTESTPGGIAGKLVDNAALIERDIAVIRSSRVGAYRFLNANRSLLGIPPDVDVRVIAMATNQREGDRGLRLTPETIIQYVWDVHLPLDDVARRAGIEKIVVHPGGTIAIDEGVNVRFFAPQPLDEPEREQVRRDVTALVRRGEVEVDPKPHLRSERPLVLLRDAEGSRLRLNTAAMHRARAAAS